MEKQYFVHAGVESFCEIQWDYRRDMQAAPERRLHGSPTSKYRSIMLSWLSTCILDNFQFVDTTQGLLGAASEGCWWRRIANVVALGDRTCKYCDGRGDDKSGSSAGRKSSVVDAYVLRLEFRRRNPCPKRKIQIMLGWWWQTIRWYKEDVRLIQSSLKALKSFAYVQNWLFERPIVSQTLK